MNDNDILRLMREAPPRGQRALFDEYYNYVCAVVVRVLHGYGSREDMDECVMDVFTNVFLRLDEARVTGLKGFIGTIARNTAISRRRSLKADGSAALSMESDLPFGLSTGEDIAGSTEASVLAGQLLEKIKELGKPDSELIIQRYFYDRSSGEIASAMGMTPAAVRMRCARALKRLRKDLKELL